MPRTDKILRSRARVGERANRGGALLGRNAGRQSLAPVDGDGEGCRQRRFVKSYHRRAAQRISPLAGKRHGDDATGVAHEKGELLLVCVLGCHNQIALVLSVRVVGDDDHPARGDLVQSCRHLFLPSCIRQGGGRDLVVRKATR